jgi:hypothetical protein
VTWEGFGTFLQTFGLPLTMLVIVLWTGARGMWVFGRTHDDVVEDRNYWRAQALKGTELADSALAAAPPPRRVRARP